MFKGQRQSKDKGLPFPRGKRQGNDKLKGFGFLATLGSFLHSLPFSAFLCKPKPHLEEYIFHKPYILNAQRSNSSSGNPIPFISFVQD